LNGPLNTYKRYKSGRFLTNAMGQRTKSLRSSPLRGGKSERLVTASREDSDSAVEKAGTHFSDHALVERPAPREVSTSTARRLQILRIAPILQVRTWSMAAAV
jgi:hypothetical protein